MNTFGGTCKNTKLSHLLKPLLKIWAIYQQKQRPIIHYLMPVSGGSLWLYQVNILNYEISAKRQFPERPKAIS
ncbi:MAG: hypothetical protein EBR12_03425 [Proteobacteria bacterium]|nr:hypothetical protein [Pseudomonadota bacterium]